MNNYLAIVADIAAKLAAIDGIGIIQDRPRLTASWAAYIARFKNNAGRILGGEISRGRVTEHRRGAFFRHHTFVLRWYLGFQDEAATDAVFQQLVEEICAAFRLAEPPAGASWLYQDGDNQDNSPAQVPVIDERMFGGVLCHHAEIHLSVTERIV
ncbi:MAG: hypothetical protein IH614_06260 [Desulfuromonadales bacterium]|nr:hypothetical protein [Desulfuromonadales bacterium]